jgi:hypothetical protein
MADLCVLVERYEPGNDPLPETVVRLDESAAATSAEDSPSQLLTILSVPADEMVFARGGLG